MRVIERIRLVDAFAEWGAHEARGRLRHLNLNLDSREDPLAAVEVALTTRSALAWRFFAAGPAATLRVLVEPEDIRHLILADGRTVDDWTTTAVTEQTESGQHFRRLADSSDAVCGPLLCSARKVAGRQIIGPVVVFDGWHRVAAWVAHFRRGHSYLIAANLVVTKLAVRLMD